MCTIHNFPIIKITLREADFNTDRDILGRLYTAWARDYAAAGDLCASPKTPIDKLFCSADRFFLAYKDNDFAGIFILRNEHHVWRIKVAYVINKYRGQGVAKKLYDLAVRDFGACEIELTYKRVLKRVEYWQALGFKSLKGKVGHGYSYKSVCVLSIEDHWHSISAISLELNNIERYRRSLGSTYEFKSAAA